MEGRLSDKQDMKQDEPSDIPFGSVVLKLNRLKTLTHDFCVFFLLFFFQKSSKKKEKEKQTCKGCNESFNFTKRKHHCKSCGAVSTDGTRDIWALLVACRNIAMEREKSGNKWKISFGQLTVNN